MPLPKINTPTYELVLPSNNKKIKYRPFLVREEKILIIALESQDMKQITDAIVEILNACVMTKGVEITKLATFDIEYLFLNVRAKSVGETVDVNITCPDDGETSVEMEIPIDAIKVKKTKNHKNIIKLDDQYSMKLKYPELSKFVENNFEVGSDTSDVSKSLSMITSCIEMIYDNEESWDANDSTTEELEEFIEQLNTKQFKEVERFFDTMPKLSHTVKVNNPKTKVESDVVLEGLGFFHLSMGHTDLESYFKINFALMQHHKYSLTEIENMIPWEREVYLTLLRQHVEEENLKAQQNNG